jgi:hypothetical protein
VLAGVGLEVGALLQRGVGLDAAEVGDALDQRAGLVAAGVELDIGG